jgi:plasmid stabilization system protein ParE
MRLLFHPDAEEELLEASRYYELEAPGVGLAFLAEVHRTLQAILDHPATAPKVNGNIRKKILKHFPYSILLATGADQIIVVAVAHHKRRPTYWHKRLRSHRRPS